MSKVLVLPDSKVVHRIKRTCIVFIDIFINISTIVLPQQESWFSVTIELIRIT